MQKLEHLLSMLRDNPETVEFSDVIKVIDSHYTYTPTRFTNGPATSDSDDGVINEAGTNEGSCKIFAFASINDLTKQQTLHCFGQYYRDDVLCNPDGDDHQNIRNFIKYGWQYIEFDEIALELPTQ